MNWPQTTAVLGVIGIIAYSARNEPIQPAPPHDPCVAFSYFPEVPGYEPERMMPTVVFIDAPIFDRLFAGCTDPERRGILAVLPGNVVRVLRRERK